MDTEDTPKKPRWFPGFSVAALILGSATFLVLDHFQDVANLWTLVPFILLMLALGNLQARVRTGTVVVFGLIFALGGNLAVNGSPTTIGFTPFMEFYSRIMLVSLAPLLLGSWTRRVAERSAQRAAAAT